MAGSIRTPPVNKEYEAHYDRAMDKHTPPYRREEQLHSCEHCGRVMKYADQSCACIAKRPLS